MTIQWQKVDRRQWCAQIAVGAGMLAQAGGLRAQTKSSSDRVALVIGNSDYRGSPLTNPRNDARAMGALLQQAGFRTDSLFDTTQQQMAAAVERFGQAIRDPSVKFGLFYYAGHGLQMDWRNYLVPVSANIRTPADVRQQTVDVSQLLRYMEDAKGRSFLVVLDACRDDPFGDTFRPPAKGLSQFDAPVGSLLAYATAPGSVAMDGIGDNGLYTSHLLREFAVRGARLEDAFKRVRLNVRLASQGRQIPWESTSLEEDVYLFPSERKKLSDAEQDQQLEQEISSWLRVKSSNDVLALANFVRQYPSGSASELAMSRMNRLLAVQGEQEVRRMDAARKQLQEAEAERLAVEKDRQAREAAALKAQQDLQLAQAEAQRAAAAARLQAQQQAQREAQALADQRALEAAARAAELEAAQRLAAEATRIAEAARLAEQAKAQALTQLVASAPAASASLPPTPYYKGYDEHRRQYRPGDVFAFQVIDGFTKAAKPLVLRVTSVDVEADRVEFNQGEYLSDTMGNIITNLRGSMSTPRQFYPAELFVGKKWRTEFKQVRPNGVTFTFRYTLKVVGRESITVPAGTFNAFKIEARGFNVQLRAALSRNIWVAPGVAADIVHETIVRLANGNIDQFDRQELVSLSAQR